MVEGHAFDNSVIIEDYFAYPQSIENGEEVPASKLTNLTFSGKEFAWHGSLDQLKDFLKYNLKLEGNGHRRAGMLSYLLTAITSFITFILKSMVFPAF